MVAAPSGRRLGVLGGRPLARRPAAESERPRVGVGTDGRRMPQRESVPGALGGAPWSLRPAIRYGSPQLAACPWMCAATTALGGGCIPLTVRREMHTAPLMLAHKNDAL